MPEITQYSEEDMQINAESADINEVAHDNIADPDLKTEKSPHFRDYKEIISDLSNRYELTEEEIRFDLPSVVENFRAGKNLYNFCRQLSSQEKRPVLVANNARGGAQLQFGFPHWLANFDSEQQANSFVEELENNEEYVSSNNELNKYIEELKIVLQNNLEVVSDQGWFARQALNNPGAIQDILSLDDPSADVRLEIMLIPGGQPTEKQSAIINSLEKIQQYKDSIRSMIFKKANVWIKEGALKSFVYGINHWKLSGSGSMHHEVEAFQNKLSKTFELPETLMVFADTHKYPLNDEMKQQAEISYFRPDIGHAVPQGTHIRHSFLEYPLSDAANGRLAAGRKELLEKAHQADPKILDLWVTYPTSSKEKSTSVGQPGSGVEGYWDPFRIMRHNETEIKCRKIIGDLRKTPEWAEKLKKRTFLEPNYSFAGTDYN